LGSEEDAPVSSEEEKNKALVRSFWEAVADADLDTLDELLAPDFVDHSLLADQKSGREGYKQQVAEQHAALSDVRCIIEDQLAKGDKVVTRITWRSIHDRGEYFGLMPRGTQVEVTAMAMHRIVGGKITEEWSEGSGSAEVALAHLEQEIRERVEQDLSVEKKLAPPNLRNVRWAVISVQLLQRLLSTSRIKRDAAMVARTENVPCTRASFTSSSDPRSSGSSKNLPASLVAVHAASAVDRIKTIRFCISSLKPSPPPLLDLPVNHQSVVARRRLYQDGASSTA
jgi:predicted ester cyclase